MDRRALRPKGWSPRATEQRMVNRTAAEWVRLYHLNCPQRLAQPLGWLEALLVGSKVTTIDEVIAEAERLIDEEELVQRAIEILARYPETARKAYRRYGKDMP